MSEISDFITKLQTIYEKKCKYRDSHEFSFQPRVIAAVTRYGIQIMPNEYYYMVKIPPLEVVIDETELTADDPEMQQYIQMLVASGKMDYEKAKNIKIASSTIKLL